MKKLSEKKLQEIAKKIKLLILDVDGVLTDGSIILDNRGNEFKSFHVRDGHGIKMLLKKGIHVAIITGRDSKVVEKRARELHIRDVFQKSHDKRVPYRKLAEKYALHDSEIAYVGDDIVDLPLLQICGLSVAVADAHDTLKAVINMTTREKGGRGAVREVCDFLLRAKGFWKDIMDEYS
jgi:3-deoxy-D-manno-octulosonate 8-phosphate phosphatase (KDO 8-P phosphatase)